MVRAQFYLFEEIHHDRVHLEVSEVIVNPKQNHSGNEVAIRGILKPKTKRKGNQLVHGFLYYTRTDFMPLPTLKKGQNLFGILVSSLQRNTFIIDFH